MSVDNFAVEARQFCGWATGNDEAAMSAQDALVRIVSLYGAALTYLSLPTLDEDEKAGIQQRHWGSIQAILERTPDLPFENYWEISDPLDISPGEPVVGSLTDDFGDIYMDIARGLALYDAGQIQAAQWEWKFHFDIHWGEHATSAIRALHWYVVKEERDG